MTAPDSSEESTPGESALGRTNLKEEDLAAVDAIVAPADERTARLYPGDSVGRQPVHTVYVPADEVSEDLSAQWGTRARAALDDHAPTPLAFAQALALADDEGHDLDHNGIWARVLDKLAREPIEDLRIDLEDGYGVRDNDTEDQDAVASARALAAAVSSGEAPPFCGIRFKALEAATRRRGIRTLDLVLGTLLEHGGLPDGFVVTLPKVTSLEQVEAMVEVCVRLESAYGLEDRRLRFEVQIETAQAILAHDGTALVARVVHAGDGRVSGLHFGTYDYTAGLGISAPYQAMDHAAAEHAKLVMQLAASQTGVRVSDGACNVLPVGDSADVHAAWALHARLVRRSLQRGYYQGWDLHPAQLASRFVTTHLFFRRGLTSAVERLAAYVGSRDVTSAFLDEPATAQALAGFVLRGLDCGAVDDADLQRLDRDQLRALASRRFG